MTGRSVFVLTCGVNMYALICRARTDGGAVNIKIIPQAMGGFRVAVGLEQYGKPITIFAMNYAAGSNLELAIDQQCGACCSHWAYNERRRGPKQEPGGQPIELQSHRCDDPRPLPEGRLRRAPSATLRALSRSMWERDRWLFPSSSHGDPPAHRPTYRRVTG